MSVARDTVGFIGCGNMAQAIGFSAISKGVLKPENITVSAPSDTNLGIWKEKGVKTTHSNGEVVSRSNLVFIAVKPQYFFEAMKKAFEGLNNKSSYVDRTFVSIMVGCKIAYIKQVLSDLLGVNLLDINVVRVMPNTPLLVGVGCSVVCCDRISSYEENAVKRVLEILKAGGGSEEVKESLMDAASAILGSGPAYMYTIIEALADGGVRCGLPRALALRLAAQTMAGGAAMVLQSDQHPAQLRDAVCSAGGTTIAAVHSLERHGIRGAFMDAVEAAVKRAQEL